MFYGDDWMFMLMPFLCSVQVIYIYIFIESNL
jgi:hypothetical protein